jgi:hypothetical protein
MAAVIQVKEGTVQRSGSWKWPVTVVSVPFLPFGNKTFRICADLPSYTARARARAKEVEAIVS